jgi:hypothetical protein
LGASVVQDRSDATLLIVNPCCPEHEAELRNLQFMEKAYPGVARPQVLPYHYLSQCLVAHTRVSPDTLDPPVPFFVHPDYTKSHHPLRVWVSVNVARREPESAEEARAVVTELLLRGGCLAVTKRAHADVLIVDRNTNFFRTVQKEKEAGGRDWQRLAERDWVEATCEIKKVEWTGLGDEEGDDEVDSMAEDMPMRGGKGPGRPTGK